MNDEIINKYYAKQINLPNFGIDGQNKLINSKVLIIGAGALGCSAILYLSAIGIGTLGICDGDNVEIENLHRQILYDIDDIGKNKAVISVDKIKRKNPYIKSKAYSRMITCENINLIASDYDIVLDCSDNYDTKFLVHDYGYNNKKTIIQGNIYQYEGEVFVFPFQNLTNCDIPCYRCLWDHVPKTFDRNTSIKGVIGIVPGIVGLLQSFEAIKLILGFSSEESSIGYLYNSIECELNKIRWCKNDKCKLCCRERNKYICG